MRHFSKVVLNVFLAVLFFAGCEEQIEDKYTFSRYFPIGRNWEWKYSSDDSLIFNYEFDSETEIGGLPAYLLTINGRADLYYQYYDERIFTFKNYSYTQYIVYPKIFAVGKLVRIYDWDSTYIESGADPTLHRLWQNIDLLPQLEESLSVDAGVFWSVKFMQTFETGHIATRHGTEIENTVAFDTMYFWAAETVGVVKKIDHTGKSFLLLEYSYNDSL